MKYRIAGIEGEKLQTNEVGAVKKCLKTIPRQTDLVLSISYTEKGFQGRLDCAAKAGALSDEFEHALTDEPSQSASVTLMRHAIRLPLEIPEPTATQYEEPNPEAVDQTYLQVS